MSYDPAFLNTASCAARSRSSTATPASSATAATRSSSSRSESTYLEIAYLLIHGELPTHGRARRAGRDDDHPPHVPAREREAAHGGLPLRRAPDGDARSAPSRRSRPSTPRPANVDDPDARMQQVVRLIAKVPTIAAFSYRHSRGLPYVYPDNELGFTGELPLDDVPDGRAAVRAEPALERALEVLFILHADHEQNCCANAMRAIGSSQGRSVRRARRRGRRALRPAPRRRQRGGAAHARRDRRP